MAYAGATQSERRTRGSAAFVTNRSRIPRYWLGLASRSGPADSRRFRVASRDAGMVTGSRRRRPPPARAQLGRREPRPRPKTASASSPVLTGLSGCSRQPAPGARAVPGSPAASGNLRSPRCALRSQGRPCSAPRGPARPKPHCSASATSSRAFASTASTARGAAPTSRARAPAKGALARAVSTDTAGFATCAR